MRNPVSSVEKEDTLDVTVLQHVLAHGSTELPKLITRTGCATVTIETTMEEAGLQGATPTKDTKGMVVPPTGLLEAQEVDEAEAEAEAGTVAPSLTVITVAALDTLLVNAQSQPGV